MLEENLTNKEWCVKIKVIEIFVNAITRRAVWNSY
jgi:hypothetical protein